MVVRIAKIKKSALVK